MILTTPVTDFGDTFEITTSHNILATGSCFANIMGQRLKEVRLNIVVNPTGTLYNPYSIFDLVEIALYTITENTDPYSIAERCINVSPDGIWHSWLGNTMTDGTSREECIEKCVEAIKSISKIIEHLDVWLVTLGTDHCYCIKDNTTPLTCVANCHKAKSDLFVEKILSINEICDRFDFLYTKLKELRPKMKTLFTLSPYRYVKYGLHQNMLSKSRLALTIEECKHKHKDVYYFAAYEILNDELRDYRFYDRDMLHPSEIAQEFIWQKFQDLYADKRLKDYLKTALPLVKMTKHHPMSPLGTTDLKNAIKKRTEEIKKVFPELKNNWQ